MPDDLPAPANAHEAITRRSFNVVRRGYEPAEVTAYLASLARQLTELRAEVAELREREADLHVALDAAEQRAVDAVELDERRLAGLVGEETARVIEAARTAADEIRARAQVDAHHLVEAGRAEVAERLVEAAAEVEDRVREADDAVAERLLLAADAMQSARAEVAAVLEAARAEADAVVAAAVEQAAVAQAASADELAAARRQAEELVARAARRADELVAEAAAVREREVGDLARRRNLLRRQVEQLQAGRDRLLEAFRVVADTVAVATAELEVALPEARAAAERAGAPPPDAPVDAPPPGGAGRPGGVVVAGRTAPASRPDPLGAALANLRASSVGVAGPRVPEPAALDDGALDDVVVDVVAPVGGVHDVGVHDGGVHDVGVPDVGVIRVGVPDVGVPDRGTSTDVAPVGGALSEGVPSERVGAGVAAVGGATGPADTAAAIPRGSVGLDVDDVLRRRDRALAPVVGTLRRRLTGALADEENEVLDALRRRGRARSGAAGPVLPDDADRVDRYRAAVERGLVEAAGVGVELGAAVLVEVAGGAGTDAEPATGLGSRGGEGPAPSIDVDDLAEEVALALVSGLRDRLGGDPLAGPRPSPGDDRSAEVRAGYRTVRAGLLGSLAARAGSAAADRGLRLALQGSGEGPRPDLAPLLAELAVGPAREPGIAPAIGPPT